MLGTLTVNFWDGVKAKRRENKNKPKNSNMLPKNLGGINPRISWTRPIWNEK
jgi:hypothetical protein